MKQTWIRRMKEPSMPHNRSKKSLLLVIATIAMLMMPAVASAAAWTAFFEPRRVWVNTDVLLVDYGSPPLQGCNTQWIRIPKTQPNYDEIPALVLVAKANGHKIKFFLNGCWDDGAGNTSMLIHSAGWVALED